MPDAMAVQVTIYLNEADQWRHRPLHLEILNYLRQENVYAAIAFHAVAGFLGRQRVKTAHMVEAGTRSRAADIARFARSMDKRQLSLAVTAGSDADHRRGRACAAT